MATRKPAKAAKAASKAHSTTANSAKKAANHKKSVAKSPAPKKAVKAAPAKKPAKVKADASKAVDRIATKLTPFLEKQRAKLLTLKDTLLDSMNGVARDSLRSQSGGDASAFGMHQADAGSDAYDRDFALSLLSQEQDSLYEIDQALKRIENGTYGVCEMSGKSIPKARLEALPFTRYTVECQAELEKRNRYLRHRQPVTSLFGLGDDDDDGDDDSGSDSKD